MDRNESVVESILTPELYFLISKFLSAGPLTETAKVLVQELEKKKVLPRRLDWLGHEHEQTFSELEKKYQHIQENHLLEICCRIGPILDKELPPSVSGIISLLGSGRQSLLRTPKTVYRARSLLDYCTRLHGVSLPDSTTTKPVHNIQNVLIGREYGGPVHRKLLVPTSLYSKTQLLRRTVGHLSSVYCVLFDRTGRYIITGADDLLVKIWSAWDGRLLATLRGASAEITDIAINLDNTMLAAGSLDRILRVWDLQTASPIAVLTGHTGMISSVNFCPSPRTDLKYLVTTSTDGSIAFWQYSTSRGQKITFAPKPIQYHEKLRPGQAQMMCATFSPGGMFLAAGSADHHVRVYLMQDDGPKRILECEAYTDAVDSVQWAHKGLRFISGSKDGTAHIWTFESQQWKSVKLSMNERLPSCPEPEEGKKLKVTMVAWDYSDNYAITAANDFTIKIWDPKTAKLHRVLRGHTDEIYVLESNPKDKHILLSAGHDGQLFLWDVEQGVSVARFLNDIDGQGYGGVFDVKWSPDGTMIAATDSHGHLLIFGLGYGPDKYQILPTELFFHTDYRPLVRDASHHVVDEQTQIMPHLMPPPFLVDAYGSPHPAKYQRYVPGRENCSSEQLIPNVTLAPDGVVIDDNLAQNGGGAGGDNFLHIDRLIAALANRQGVSGGGSGSGTPAAAAGDSPLDRRIEALANRQNQEQLNERPSTSRASSVTGNLLNRNSGPPVAVRRQSELNTLPPTPRQGTTWGRPPAEQQQQDQAPPPPSPMKYIRRVYVRPMKYEQLLNLKQMVHFAGQNEMQEYKREMRRRPIMISTASATNPSQANTGGGRSQNTRGGGGGGRNRNVNGGGSSNGGGAARTISRPGRRRGQNNQPRPAYRTRAVRDAEEMHQPEQPEEEEEEESSAATSDDTSYSNAEENLEEDSDSDSESSDYSDWVADTPGPNLEPPQRAKRKPLSRRRTFSDDSSEDGAASEQATTSAAAAAASKALKRRDKQRVPMPPTAPNGEIPEVYRPAEWLSEVIPRKTPYYPQMGDEVVYFRQGHQRYLDAVRLKKVYKLTHSSEPWHNRTLRDRELVRVIGIKYEIRPPRLCCLKLAMIDEDGNMTGSSFKIKYHDMPDVLDFLVLRQTFDLAVQRNWNIGDRFRCMIGDGWWMGQIESRHALSPEFPDSYFMCFRVRWDNGEYEFMSPWDMEPIDENRLPDEVGGAVSVLPEEIRATLYQPKSEEWHRGDRDGSCRRIINGLEQVMRLSIAEHFLAPVDLNIYPDYAYLIEYPIDLTTVKSRFENHFYRRITSAQFDVRYLATNAEKYNRRHTNIVKHARIITDLCLRVIREPNDIDVAAVYHQLVDVYHSSETENEDSDSIVPSTSTGPTTSAAAIRNSSISSTRRSSRVRSDGDWRVDCRQLLDLMCQRPDSEPFREPVDTIEFPDYLEIIATPMDLRTVKEDLLGGNYDDPLDFAKDVRLIFQNSKNYNTNKRSRIYAMTLRLSAFFESQMKTVISNWKAARRRANKAKAQLGGRSGGSGGGATSSSPNKTRTPSKPKTRRNQQQQQQKASRRLLTSADDDDDDDDDDDVDDGDHGGRSNGTSRLTQKRGAVRNGSARSGVVASTSGSNRVTSSSQTSRRRGMVEQRPTTQRTSTRRRKAASQENDDEDDDDDADEVHQDVNVTDESTTNISSDDSSSSSDDDDDDSAASLPDDDDDDDDDDGGGKRAHHRKRGSNRKRGNGGTHDEIDSEESYKPENQRRRAGGRSSGSGKKTNKHRKSRKDSQQKRKPQARNRKRRREIDHDDDDDDHDDQDYEEKLHTPTKRKMNGRAAPAEAEMNKRRGRRKNTKERETPSAEDNDDDVDDDDDDDEENTAATTSHVDESTQDTVPRKRGRPPGSKSGVHQSIAGNDGGPSTSAAASRFTRFQQQGGRRHAAENDHSYHLPVRNGQIAESDTDSREVAAAPPRPTRSTIKRVIMAWAHLSEVENETDDAEEILPTPTPTKMNGGNKSAAASASTAAVASSSHATSRRGDVNGPSTSRAAAAAVANSSISNGGGGTMMRQLRTNRNTIVEEQEDSDADDSDNAPLASSQGSHTKRTNQRLQASRTPPHPTHLQRTRSAPTAAISSSSSAITHMTRSHATSTTSNVATSSSSSSQPAAAPHTDHDHNYLGGAATTDGPSTSAAAAATSSRNSSRRVLSRHQRNADELDVSCDPLDDTRFINSRLRSGIPSSTTPNTTIPPSAASSRQPFSRTNSNNNNNNGTVTEARRGRSRYSQEASQPETNEQEGEEEEDFGGSDEGTDGGSRTQSGHASDSDDNQPLTSFVPASTGGNRTRTNTYESQESPKRKRRQRGGGRQRSDDSSFVYDEDMFDDDGGGGSSSHRRHHKQQKQNRRIRKRRYENDSSDAAAAGNRRQRQPRGSRNQKRPKYNEQSEDETAEQQQRDAVFVNTRPRRRRADTVDSTGGEETAITTASTSRAIITHHQRAAAHDSGGGDDDDDDTDEASDEQLVSVSSRGRVRKITPKARKFLKE